MKTKNYENTNLVTIFTITILLIEIIGVFYLRHIKITTYETLSTMVVDENKMIMVVDKTKRKLLYKNTYVYYKNKKYKYKIEKDEKQTINNKIYYEIELSIEKKDNIKSQMITIYVVDKKINMIDVIKNTWGGGKN